ncbi:GABA/polyamine transporter [Yamadazyma tenuis]|uniref:GABA/polyamine transporter n=1 Tax=Candida tenuis (strain ATCC 10573 / BCRC 21748 / CBS 615 / JCM 9827 / NBRC 10315 / NRRL Y-1498 / VKM Y-70) TaxID=590646 RepID=G3AWL6_CANTC|nr:GABA/polyamine transporter [Yamadazyma tenuis ATCC 10573]EGV66563.1 GABA/polyamine transporter [Yamadazyma tenuis ATCC 10573]WEJ95312.1 GABA/polyamine transporter [Yamadazyma tenuis]
MSDEEAKLQSVRSNIHVDDLRIQSILSNKGVTINVDHEVDSDEAMILALGYKQEFKREFNLWTVFAVSFSVLGLLPSIAACVDYQQLVVGASPVPWILAVLFIISVALSMAEVASAFPTSAGTPYAVSQLAPKRIAPVMTWLTCWSNWLCQITGTPSVNYSGASLIFALVTYNKPSFQPTTGQAYALTLGIQFSHGILASLPTRWAARINSVGTIANVLFLAIVFVMILAGNKRQEIFADDPTFGNISKFNNNSDAWGLYNQTEFPTGMAMLMSFLGVIWAMSGYDSPFHLSEECSNAAEAVPKAIVMTAVGGGLIGLLFMFAMAYTVVSLDQIAEDPLGLGQSFVTYLSQILQKKAINAAVSMTIIASYFMGESCLLAASRVTFSYSRDGMFPFFSKLGATVNPHTQTPVYAVWINFIIGQLLLLLMFANDTAIGAIFSVGGISGFVSFITPVVFKVTNAYSTFKRGPFHLGKWSRPIGFVSIAFVAVMIPVLCFPYVKGDDLTLDEMNWTVVVYFGPMLMAWVYYMVAAHKWYKGPKSNLDEGTLVYEDVDGIPDEKNYAKEDVSSTKASD